MPDDHEHIWILLRGTHEFATWRCWCGERTTDPPKDFLRSR